ncbi:hypothetical protein Zm00014a_019853 [Zea mays]|uniref:Uncharacterized protein n=2 Tax=Zea mays TaxID=4577 RepID=A0A317YCE2_MAIZE|nr:hypothetical protein Zm00014a_019853 [Zea mays]
MPHPAPLDVSRRKRKRSSDKAERHRSVSLLNSRSLARSKRKKLAFSMASLAFGSTVAAAVAATSGRTRPARRSVLVVPPAASRGGPAPAKEEKGLGETIFGFIFKKDQLVETDPLLNKVGAAPAAASRAKTTAGKKAAGGDDSGSGGGFNLGGLGGLFAKKSS